MITKLNTNSKKNTKKTVEKNTNSKKNTTSSVEHVVFNELKPSNDIKTRFYPGQKNTLGLLHGKPDQGGTCPGATTGPGGCAFCKEGCKSVTCYVDHLIKYRPAIGNVLRHNTKLLKTGSYAQCLQLLDAEFTRFERADARKRNADPEYVAAQPQAWYRLHWAGDVFDGKYAKALADAMKMHPTTMFWGYTRS